MLKSAKFSQIENKLAQLGLYLSLVKSRYNSIASQSSRMVGIRLELVLKDYRKACNYLIKENFQAIEKIILVSNLELGFIEKLMDAESSERELGESNFFEYADKRDFASNSQRLELDLELIELELMALIKDSESEKAL